VRVDELTTTEQGARSATPDAGSASAASTFDGFVAAHGTSLRRAAHLLTGDDGAAEDLLQDTLLRAWTRWGRVMAADQPLAYVRRMLVNASVSRWRRLSREPRERLTERPPEQAVNDPVGVDQQLWALVGRLPARQRAVLVLSYYEDLPDAEVADLLGNAVGTVKSQRAKALKALRRSLAQLEEGP
jgi:RNA polymerase sigma-70 factor (sigma-E family)